MPCIQAVPKVYFSDVPILVACLWLLIRARGRDVRLSSAGGPVATLIKVAMPAGLAAFFLARV